LIGAYSYLLKYHRDFYSSKKNPGRYKEHICRGKNDEWNLTIKEKKRILLNNIYGVDIDNQAVEVTKLSLLLKVLEGETVYIQFDSTAGFTGYYGRWLAYVFLIDGTDFNVELLNNGYARVYTEGACSKESYYVTLQSQIMTDRVGLWSCMPVEQKEEGELEILYLFS